MLGYLYEFHAAVEVAIRAVQYKHFQITNTESKTGKNNEFQTPGNHDWGRFCNHIRPGPRSKRKKKCLLGNCIYLTNNGLGYKNESLEFIKPNLPWELCNGASLVKLRPKE